MGALFTASAQSDLPQLPGNPSDKSEHAAAYGVLSLLVVWALARGRWRSVTLRTIVIATLICAAYGYSDEYHQLFVPNRSYDLKDLAADAAGAALVAGAVWAWGILIRGRSGSDDV